MRTSLKVPHSVFTKPVEVNFKLSSFIAWSEVTQKLLLHNQLIINWLWSWFIMRKRRLQRSRRNPIGKTGIQETCGEGHCHRCRLWKPSDQFFHIIFLKIVTEGAVTTAARGLFQYFKTVMRVRFSGELCGRTLHRVLHRRALSNFVFNPAHVEITKTEVLDFHHLWLTE